MFISIVCTFSLKILYWVAGLANFLSENFECWKVNSAKMVNVWSYPPPPILDPPPSKLPIQTTPLPTPHYWHSVKPSTHSFVNGVVPTMISHKVKTARR